MSTAPPMQPPCTAANTGKRASAKAVKLAWRCCTISHRLELRRPCSVAPGAPPSPPSVNTAKSIPAEKCLPVDDNTMTRVVPAASSALTMAGSSVQNASTIEL